MNSLQDKEPVAGARKSTDPKIDPKVDPKTAAADAEASADPSPEDLERDIDGIRENLGGLITELDHRRHRMNPVRIVKDNRTAIAIGGAVVVGLVLGGIAWRNSRARKAELALEAGSKFSEAARARLRQLVFGRETERVREAQPNVGMKILTAAGSAIAVVAARRLSESAFGLARSKKPRRPL